jgi:hypothetical protein
MKICCTDLIESICRIRINNNEFISNVHPRTGHEDLRGVDIWF